jgi:hypothetical protein
MEKFEENRGWITIHRKLLNWQWFKTPNMVHLFITLLLKANHKDNPWQDIIIKRGQVITGRNKLSEETGISVRSIRTCLKRLKSTSEVTIKTTSKFSIITICNYGNYQLSENGIDQQTDQQTDQQVTSKRPASDQQTTTNNNDNTEDNVNNEKKGESVPAPSNDLNLKYNNKHLFKDSIYFNNIEKLKSDLGEKYKGYNILHYYNRMLNYSESNNYKSADWLATCRGWILQDDEEGKPHKNQADVAERLKKYLNDEREKEENTDFEKAWNEEWIPYRKKKGLPDYSPEDEARRINYLNVQTAHNKQRRVEIIKEAIAKGKTKLGL